MWESGALASAEVYLCRNLGRRRLKRSMREAEVGGGVGWVAKRRGRKGVLFILRCVARRRVRCSIVTGAGQDWWLRRDQWWVEVWECFVDVTLEFQLGSVRASTRWDLQ